MSIFLWKITHLWLTKVWLCTFLSLINLNGKSITAINVLLILSLVKVNSENLPLKNYSSHIKVWLLTFFVSNQLKQWSIAAKNVLFMSLVKVNIKNLPLKDYSSFDSPRYDCVLFFVTNQVKQQRHSLRKTALDFSPIQLALIKSRWPLASFFCWAGLEW